MSFIPESDLYRLVFSSKLPTAEKFTDWVTAEVLPSIRKHGAYMTPETLQAAILNPDTMIQLCQQLKAEQDKRKALEAKAEVDRPKVLFADAVSASHTSILVAKLPPGGSTAAITSGELNYWGLDGSFEPLDGQEIAFWSTAISGADGAFESPPVITVTFGQQYSSLGVTLAADTATGGYCDSVNIKWYQGTTLKADVDFMPNSAVYYCQHRVTSYDKIIITLYSTNLPYRYAKLEHIIFGVYRSFGMTELRKASLVGQMSGISEELPISTMSWALDSRGDVDYMFQLKQPVEVRNNDNLIGVYYIDSFSRSAKSIYNIDCYDAFGVLDEIPFSGGVYSGKSAKALLGGLSGLISRWNLTGWAIRH